MGGNSPLVTSVIEEVKARIQKGEFTPGRGLPSERQLVQALRVSRGVVRTAIKQMDEMGMLLCRPNCRPIVKHHPSLHRQEEATGLKHISIWLWPSPGHYSVASILKGIQSAEVPADTRLVVASVVNNPDWQACLDAEEAFLRSVAKDKHTTGVILYYIGGERNKDALDEVRKAGIPMVFVDRMPPGPLNGDYVGSDNETAARQGVQHLIDLGHERIGLISNQDEVSSVFSREAGYRRALKESRIPLRDELIVRDTLDELKGVEMALDALLSLESPPTAIVGINDHVALQIYDGLQARGFSVPQDMSVLGFDGLLRWVPGGGYLTTSLQDFERIGQLATEIVIERSTGTSPVAFRHIFLNAPLKDCGSTDKPRSSLSVKCIRNAE